MPHSGASQGRGWKGCEGRTHHALRGGLGSAEDRSTLLPILSGLLVLPEEAPSSPCKRAQDLRGFPSLCSPVRGALLASFSRASTLSSELLHYDMNYWMMIYTCNIFFLLITVTTHWLSPGEPSI